MKKSTSTLPDSEMQAVPAALARAARAAKALARRAHTPFVVRKSGNGDALPRPVRSNSARRTA